jgi:hypothetical protein
MLLVTDYDDIQGISRVLIVVFSLVLVAGAFCIAVLTLLKSRKTDVPVSRHFLAGISSFSSLFGLGRLVLLYHDYFAANEFDDVLWRLGAMISLGGLTVLAFTIEQYIFKKTRRVISVIGVACVVLVGFMPKEISTPSLYIGNVAVTVLPFFIYLYIAKISTGALRKQAMIIILGMLFSFVAMLGGSILFNTGVLDRLWSQLFAIVLSFIGLLLLAHGFVKTPSAR